MNKRLSNFEKNNDKISILIEEEILELNFLKIYLLIQIFLNIITE